MRESLMKYNGIKCAMHQHTPLTAKGGFYVSLKNTTFYILKIWHPWTNGQKFQIPVDTGKKSSLGNSIHFNMLWPFDFVYAHVSLFLSFKATIIKKANLEAKSAAGNQV